MSVLNASPLKGKVGTEIPLCDEWKCHQLGCVFLKLWQVSLRLCVTAGITLQRFSRLSADKSGSLIQAYRGWYFCIIQRYVTVLNHHHFTWALLTFVRSCHLKWKWGFKCLMCVLFVRRLTASRLDPSMLPPTPRWAAVREDSKPEGDVAEHYPLPSSHLHVPLRPLRFYWTGRAH